MISFSGSILISFFTTFSFCDFTKNDANPEKQTADAYTYCINYPTFRNIPK